LKGDADAEETVDVHGLCAVLSASVAAQQQEAVLKRLDLTAAAFDLVVALPKSPPRPYYDLSESPDALVVHVIGGKLVLTFEDELEMIRAAEFLKSPVGASQAARREATSSAPFAVYVTPKSE
jgi:hypothetical protein